MAFDVEAVTVEGTWFRHVPAGADPTRRPSPAGDNRWQHGAVVDAVYLAGTQACVWAEWYRFLAEAALPPDVALPRDLWTYQVAPLEVADLSDAGQLARVGLGQPRPGRATSPPFQTVGDQLDSDGWRGVLAPSAAHPPSQVLAVFVTGTAIPPELAATGFARIARPQAPPTGMRT